MKLAVVVLVLLPFALAASVDDKRFIEMQLTTVTSGYDILALAKKLLSQFGTDLSHFSCARHFCPEMVRGYGLDMYLTHTVCESVCWKAEELSAHFSTSTPPIDYLTSRLPIGR